jgi:hypothetical protein
VSGTLQTDELGYVLEILAEDELPASRHHRHVAYAQREQPLTPLRVVLDVDRDEIDTFFRKKLFRFEAAASPWLSEENELVDYGSHVYSPGWVVYSKETLSISGRRFIPVA